MLQSHPNVVVLFVKKQANMLARVRLIALLISILFHTYCWRVLCMMFHQFNIYFPLKKKVDNTTNRKYVINLKNINIQKLLSQVFIKLRKCKSLIKLEHYYMYCPY